MKNRAAGWFVAGVIAAAGVMPASAELPGLSGKEWPGHFVGFQNRKFQFGITAKGAGVLKVIGKKGEPVSKSLNIPVNFVVEEIKPDGTTTTRSILPESLESAQ